MNVYVCSKLLSVQNVSVNNHNSKKENERLHICFIDEQRITLSMSSLYVTLEPLSVLA